MSAENFAEIISLFTTIIFCLKQERKAYGLMMSNGEKSNISNISTPKKLYYFFMICYCLRRFLSFCFYYQVFYFVSLGFIYILMYFVKK